MTALAALPLIALASAGPALLAHRADSRRAFAWWVARVAETGVPS